MRSDFWSRAAQSLSFVLFHCAGKMLDVQNVSDCHRQDYTEPSSHSHSCRNPYVATENTLYVNSQHGSSVFHPLTPFQVVRRVLWQLAHQVSIQPMPDVAAQQTIHVSRYLTTVLCAKQVFRQSPSSSAFTLHGTACSAAV